MREPLSLQAARPTRAAGGQCAGIVPARQCRETCRLGHAREPDTAFRPRVGEGGSRPADADRRPDHLDVERRSRPVRRDLRPALPHDPPVPAPTGRAGAGERSGVRDVLGGVQEPVAVRCGPGRCRVHGSTGSRRTCCATTIGANDAGCWPMPRPGVDPILDGGFDAVDARLDAGAEGPAVARALARLTPGDRETLLLYAWADLSYREVAEALDDPDRHGALAPVACASPGPRDPRGQRLLQPSLSGPKACEGSTDGRPRSGEAIQAVGSGTGTRRHAMRRGPR